MTRRLLRQFVTLAILGVGGVALLACSSGGSDELTWDARSIQDSTDGAPFVPSILPTSVGVGDSRMLFALIDRETGTLVSDATLEAHYYRLAEDPEAEPKTSEEVATLDVVKRVLDLRGVVSDGTPAADSDLTTVYSSTPSFDAAGYWGVVLDIEYQGKTYHPRMKFWVLQETPEVGIGQPAPASTQLTLADVDSASAISSMTNPNEDMLDETVADALKTGNPIVVAFVTPTFCQTRFCGPVMDAVVQPAWEKYGDRVEFIHIEPYDLAKARGEGVLEPVPTIAEWGIRQEPFIFVIDREGIVRSKLEGVTDVNELSDAIEKVLAE